MSTKRKCLGFIEIVYFEPENIIQQCNWSELEKYLENSSGIFQSTHRLFQFINEPSNETLNKLVSSVGGALTGLALLPASLQAFLNLEVSLLAEARPNELVEKDMPGYRRHMLLKDQDSSDAVELVDRHPYIGLHIHSEENTRNKAIVDAFSANPERLKSILVSNHFIGLVTLWGRFFRLAEECECDVRHLFAEMAMNKVPEANIFCLPESAAFRLDLPKEGHALPHIANFLLQTVPNHHYPRSATRTKSPQETIEKLLEIYVPTANHLLELFNNPAETARVRAAALVLAHHHPKREELGLPPLWDTDWRSLYDISESHWYLPALAFLLTQGIKELKDEAYSAANDLVSLALSNFDTRIALDPIISQWREIACAPITHCTDAKLWE